MAFVYWSYLDGYKGQGELNCFHTKERVNV